MRANPWGRFFGRAFVEPVDDMEKPGWNQNLLGRLTDALPGATGPDVQTIPNLDACGSVPYGEWVPFHDTGRDS